VRLHGNELTRNFCIIAHIDHGKTICPMIARDDGTIHERDKQDQLLDSMVWSANAGSRSKRIR